MRLSVCEPNLNLGITDALQQIEKEQGWVRRRRWGERTLDLDILLYEDLQLHTNV